MECDFNDNVSLNYLIKFQIFIDKSDYGNKPWNKHWHKQKKINLLTKTYQNRTEFI